MLAQVVAILCGYPDQAREAAQSWLELLIAQLLHSYPALTVKAGLPSLLDQCISSMGSTESWQLSVAQQILEVGLLASNEDACPQLIRSSWSLLRSVLRDVMTC